MELIGAYARITVGRGIKDGQVELKISGCEDKEDVAIDQVLSRVKEIFTAED